MSGTLDKQKEELINQNLARLAEVNVSVTIEVARMRMPLKKVLSMAPGELIELGKKTSEPMTLRVGNIVIASCEFQSAADGLPAIRITAVHNKHKLTELDQTG